MPLAPHEAFCMRAKPFVLSKMIKVHFFPPLIAGVAVGKIGGEIWAESPVVYCCSPGFMVRNPQDFILGNFRSSQLGLNLFP